MGRTKTKYGIGIRQSPLLSHISARGHMDNLRLYYTYDSLSLVGILTVTYKHLNRVQSTTYLFIQQSHLLSPWPSEIQTTQLYSPNMPGRLEGKVALVSGSSQGFGRGILETFVREGAVVLGLDLQATDGPVDGYSEKQAYQIKANVAEEASWEKAVRQHYLSYFTYIDSTLLTKHFAAGDIYRTVRECPLYRRP